VTTGEILGRMLGEPCEGWPRIWSRLHRHCSQVSGLLERESSTRPSKQDARRSAKTPSRSPTGSACNSFQAL